MRVVNCGRNDCILDSGKHVSMDSIPRKYRCSDCEGVPVALAIMEEFRVVGYNVQCGRCGGQNFISRYEIGEQMIEADEVLNSMPVELQRQYRKARSAQVGDAVVSQMKQALFGGE